MAIPQVRESQVRGYFVMFAHLMPLVAQLTPHPARVPMKCIGIADHPLPKGEGKTQLSCHPMGALFAES